jgi:hypothetical protein
MIAGDNGKTRPVTGRRVMPQRFSAGFDPEAVGAMMAAFDKACAALGLLNRPDAMTEGVARMIVEQARSGERDPDRLCALALQALQQAPHAG